MDNTDSSVVPTIPTQERGHYVIARSKKKDSYSGKRRSSRLRPGAPHSPTTADSRHGVGTRGYLRERSSVFRAFDPTLLRQHHLAFDQELSEEQEQ